MCGEQVSSCTGVELSTDDDPLVDGPLISPDALHSAIRKEFRSIPTTYCAVLLALTHVFTPLLLFIRQFKSKVTCDPYGSGNGFDVNLLLFFFFNLPGPGQWVRNPLCQKSVFTCPLYTYLICIFNETEQGRRVQL